MPALERTSRQALSKIGMMSDKEQEVSRARNRAVFLDLIIAAKEKVTTRITKKELVTFRITTKWIVFDKI